MGRIRLHARTQPLRAAYVLWPRRPNSQRRDFSVPILESEFSADVFFHRYYGAVAGVPDPAVLLMCLRSAAFSPGGGGDPIPHPLRLHLTIFHLPWTPECPALALVSTLNHQVSAFLMGA